METPPPVIVRKTKKFFKPQSPPSPVDDWNSIILIDGKDPADALFLDNSEMPMSPRESDGVMDVSRTLDDISFSTPAETPRRAMSFAANTPGTILRRPMSTLRGGARRLFSDEANVTFENGDESEELSPIQRGDNRESGLFLTPDRRTIPVGPSRAVPFEIFEDGESTPVNMSSSSQVHVRRVFANTSRAARDFALVVFSTFRTNEGRIIVTRKTETLNPMIEAGCGVIEQGRCRFSFQNNFLESNQERENNRPGDEDTKRAPGHVGVVEIGRSLFPPTISRGRNDVLDIDPVFVTPANAHVTVLMPSEAAAFKSLDHFVVQIFSAANLTTKLMHLAIHKSVFARLLLVDSLSIPFSNVPVGPDEYVNMLMHVSRVRRQKKRINHIGITLEERIFVVIKSIDFSVPEGFERIRFAMSPSKKEEELVPKTPGTEPMGLPMVVALPARTEKKGK